MQQRGLNTTMASDNGESDATPPPSRGRNSKLKVLVRSHAMREEASPPREPTPNHLLSPCIKLTPSPEECSTSPCPNLSMFSPSGSRCSSPCRSNSCISPTSTVVPSPNSRCSPLQCASSPQHHRDGVEHVCSPKYLNKLNKQNLEMKSGSSHSQMVKKKSCDCDNPNCIKCIKAQERNINNNLTNVNNNVAVVGGGSGNSLAVVKVGSRGKLRQQSSSQGSFESSSNSPCLSRDSSSEQYTDTTGIDLDIFIPETLNRNAKDRALMLRIEQELVSLAKDKFKTHYKFPPMSSYQRMLVHRCAAYFGMDHNIEASGKCVVVNKTKNTRVPDLEFKEHIKGDVIFSEEPRRSILKRDSNSIEDYNFKSPDRSFSMENRRSKSFEEREEEYERARRRIFNREMHDGSSEDFSWVEMPWSSTESEYTSRLRLPEPRRHHNKLLKVQSEETGETLRPCVAKSYSFGGYGGASVLCRDDSVLSTHSAGPRLLTKQDSAASSVSWRLSPSSSGYKSQSQMSESVTPSPTSTPHPITDERRQDNVDDNQLVWAVTDIQNVPKGSIIINPQTGKPLKNDDGSLYHYDPLNPPAGCIPDTSKPPPSPPRNIILKERPVSPPKKHMCKLSPSRKLVLTNSSTSPILPYSPPISAGQNRSFQYNGDNLQHVQYPVYSSTYQTAVPENQMYQQPYLVYSTTPFSVPVPQQFDGRIEQAQVPEMANTFYVSENPGGVPPQPTQQLAYQQPPPPSYWNQQQPIAFFQSTQQPPTPPHQRFQVPLQNQNPPTAGLFPGGYPQNFATHPHQNPELMPMFPNQPMQMIYSNQQTAPNQLIYQNQPPPPLLYTQNPVFPAPVYQPPYPQNTPTPNSCTSQVSNSFHHDQALLQQLAHGVQQMSIAPGYRGTPQFGKGMNKKLGKGFMMGSSQSSTGTNSPAATIIAGYCPSNAYRTPPETPPSQFGFHQGNFTVPSMIFRQMNNVRPSTPGTARNSRSPTPANEVHFERQKMPLPTNMYQGMPYVVQSDTRLIPGRGQPNAYRQGNNAGKQQNQGSENRYHKGRKSKGNKPGSLPPSGKPGQ